MTHQQQAVRVDAKPPPAQAGTAARLKLARILVPVDLSPRSIVAGRYARRLAADLGAEVVFLHVIDSTLPLAGTMREIRDELITAIEPGAGRFLIRDRPPVRAILDTAAEERAGAILMPTRGLGLFSRWLGRSVTAQVLREASFPVWAALDDALAATHHPIRNVLCGLSLGPRTAFVLTWAAALARTLNARLAVVYASPGFASSPGYPCDREWRCIVEEMVSEEIFAVQAEAGTRADVWLEPGHPPAAVAAVAERLRSDLLVIGKSPGQLRARSYATVCRAPCPVVSV